MLKRSIKNIEEMTEEWNRTCEAIENNFQTINDVIQASEDCLVEALNMPIKRLQDNLWKIQGFMKK